MYDAWRVLFAASDWFYNRLLRYVLSTIGFIALISLGIYGATLLLVEVLHLEGADVIWDELARRTGASPLAARFAVNGALQFNFLLMFHGMIAAVAESTRLDLSGWFHERYCRFGDLDDDEGEARARRRPTRPLMGVGGAVLAAIVLAPSLIQPTITPLDLTRLSLYERATNLFDGSAAVATPESVLSLHHRLVRRALPDPGVGASGDHFDAAVLLSKREDDAIADALDRDIPLTAAPDLSGPQPMMDRWDPIIWEAANGDARRFAQIKAFMWVESTGRQFAISHTGCIGLMQFCSKTARSSTFREIFGPGQVAACGCRSTSCRVPRSTQREMEAGDRRVIARHAGSYPCDLGDARFDARKSILAGARYIANLDAEFGGNMYLMYIGYNSGPTIARRVWHATGEDPGVSLPEIGEHLRAAMRPTYGAKSSRRASSLLRKHLPKIARAHSRYAKAAGSLDPLAPDPLIASVAPEPEPVAPPEPPVARVDRTGDGTGEEGNGGAPAARITSTAAGADAATEGELAAADVVLTDGAQTCAVPEAPHAEPVEVPFMKGIALNLERADVERQEGEGLAPTDYLEARWREAGLALHETAREHPSPRHALVPPTSYAGRWLFGLEATRYQYSMNPHHGRYDELRATLTAKAGEPATRFTRFTTLRDRLSKALGAPELEQLMVRGEDLDEPITRTDLDLDWKARRARARSVWSAGDLRVELATTAGSPDGARAHVATLTMWTPSAEPNRMAAHAEWADYTPFPLPSARAKLLHDPRNRPVLPPPVTPKDVTEDAAEETNAEPAKKAAKEAPAKKKVAKKKKRSRKKKTKTRREDLKRLDAIFTSRSDTPMTF
jgi:hypothetical protein